MANETTISTLGHEQVVHCSDPSTGLVAIIAIHDTTLGPALGGCRFWPYKDHKDALIDVLRLSRGMTYKASVAGLKLGGGKSVIIGDPEKLKSEQLFKNFGRFVNSLCGRYITAEDVNVRVEDMNIVKTQTEYVTGINCGTGGSGDPSPITAYGVFEGIRASVTYRLNKDSLNGVKVAVTGCGSVGRTLCSYLYKAGAELIIADINPKNIEQTLKQVKATTVSAETIHKTDCDVFAPCALGGGLNDQTIPEIKAKIIAGAANNQLLDENLHMQMLDKHQITYAPDYVINAGGLINVAHELKGYNQEKAKDETSHIYDTLLKIYDLSNKINISSLAASNQIAEDRIQKSRKDSHFLQHCYQNQEWIKRQF